MANDGVTNSDPATVTITVLTNLPPVANGDSYSVVSGRTLTVSSPGILSNDTVGWGTNLTAVLVSGPTNGTFSLGTNGGFTYTATNNFIGTDSFNYLANDGVTNSAPATVTISVTANYPPVANNDSYNVITNTTLSVASPGVLGNDTDANGDSLTSVLVSGPAHGTLKSDQQRRVQLHPRQQLRRDGHFHLSSQRRADQFGFGDGDHHNHDIGGESPARGQQ